MSTQQQHQALRSQRSGAPAAPAPKMSARELAEEAARLRDEAAREAYEMTVQGTNLGVEVQVAERNDEQYQIDPAVLLGGLAIAPRAQQPPQQQQQHAQEPPEVQRLFQPVPFAAQQQLPPQHQKAVAHQLARQQHEQQQQRHMMETSETYQLYTHMRGAADGEFKHQWDRRRQRVDEDERSATLGAYVSGPHLNTVPWRLPAPASAVDPERPRRPHTGKSEAGAAVAAVFPPLPLQVESTLCPSWLGEGSTVSVLRGCGRRSLMTRSLVQRDGK